MFPILVPPPKPQPVVPSHSPWRGLARGMAIAGFLLFLALGSMVVTEHKVPVPITQFELAAAGLAAFLLSWRAEAAGGALLTASMALAIILCPLTLGDWRPWFIALETFLGLTGTALVLLPRGQS